MAETRGAKPSETSSTPPLDDRRSTAPRDRRRRAIFLSVSAAVTVAVLVGAAEVLLPFVFALVVAFILLPAVLRVERMRVPRWIAILLVYAVTLGAIGGFFRVVIPSLAGEIGALRHELPHRIKFIQDNWLPAIDDKLEAWSARSEPPAEKSDAADPKSSPRDDDDDVPPPGPPPTMTIEKRADGSYAVVLGEHVQIRKVGEDLYQLERPEKERRASSAKMIRHAFDRATKYVSENTGEVLKLGQIIVGAVWRGVFTLVMTLMLAGYMMLTHEAIVRFFRDLVSVESQPAFDRLLHRLEKGLGGVVRGQLVICGVNGVLSAIGFWLFDLKYWPIMALVAAVGSIVPIFGSIISTIPAVAIGLTQSPGTAFAILAWSIGIHQLEANLLNPKIIGDAAKIHPVLVVFSLIVGEHFFQIKGALLAVPCMSILQTLFLHFREVTMGLADPLATQAPPPATTASTKGQSASSSAPTPPKREASEDRDPG